MEATSLAGEKYFSFEVEELFNVMTQAVSKMQSTSNTEIYTRQSPAHKRKNKNNRNTNATLFFFHSFDSTNSNNNNTDIVMFSSFLDLDFQQGFIRHSCGL